GSRPFRTCACSGTHLLWSLRPRSLRGRRVHATRTGIGDARHGPAQPTGAPGRGPEGRGRVRGASQVRAARAAPQPFDDRPIARRTRAYQPPVLRAVPRPPPPTAPAVRPWSRVPQRSQSLRPVMEVYTLPRIF